jgi:DNA polymerase V
MNRENINYKQSNTGTASYLCIDLKSFYASVECRVRGLDPLTANLVVADVERTEKTICLAVSPSLKSFGIPGRARLFEVLERVREINAERFRRNGGRPFTGKSADICKLNQDPGLELDFIPARPQMQLYINVSSEIYNIYLNYVAPEDIHVYSIDEVFMDVTSYLHSYGMTAQELARKMIHEVLDATGITATAGIGTNMYLAKVAMDVVAKHMQADEYGVRIAELDEFSYRRCLWTHQPLTDFWRVGVGYAKKLHAYGMYTMGDVARISMVDEDLLYRLFGINAELLIDHAWGYEPCTMAEVKAYRPENSSISSGQVLQCPYTKEKGKLILKEMADQMSLDLVDKRLMTDQIVLYVGYDTESLRNPEIRKKYHGPVSVDGYGRAVPKSVHASANLKEMTSSTRQITEAFTMLYEKLVDPMLLIRRFTIAANHVRDEAAVYDSARNHGCFCGVNGSWEQMDLFTDYEEKEREERKRKKELEREKRLQKAAIEIKKKFGKNAILKGMNLFEEGTMQERNMQIGGHRA